MVHNRPILGASESSTAWSTCTVVRENGSFCEAPVPADAPVSSCKRHLVSAFLYCENLIAEQRVEAEAGISAGALAELWTERLRESRQPVVYYARVDGYIKIGTTLDVRTRMIQLRAECVLATEPGSFELERRRHRQFRLSKAPVGTELFVETEELVAHIRSLQMTRAELLRGHTKNLLLSDEEMAAYEVG